MLQVLWFHEQKHQFTDIFLTLFEVIHNQIFHYFTHFDSMLTLSAVISTKSGLERKKIWRNWTPVKNANEMYKILILLIWFCHADYKVPHHLNYYRACNIQHALHFQTLTFPSVEKMFLKVLLLLRPELLTLTRWKSVLLQSLSQTSIWIQHNLHFLICVYILANQLRSSS